MKDSCPKLMDKTDFSRRLQAVRDRDFEGITAT